MSIEGLFGTDAEFMRWVLIGVALAIYPFEKLAEDCGLPGGVPAGGVTPSSSRNSTTMRLIPLPSVHSGVIPTRLMKSCEVTAMRRITSSPVSAPV